MAIPAQPTATTICTEAFKLFGKTTPTSGEITRATDYGIEIVKDDLKRMGLEWDFLREVTYLPMVVGKSYVQLPTDYAKFLSARLVDGTSRSTLQTAASTTATLASTEGAGSEIVGKFLIIVSGTGTNQARQVISYDTSTKVATVDSAWTTTPVTSDGYLIANSHRELEYNPIFALNMVTEPGRAGTPAACSVRSDSAEGDLYMDKSADKVYVIELEYYKDILKIDLSSTLYSRILRLLNGLFIQGVFVWLLQDDSRAGMERGIYERKLLQTAGLHLYPHNVQNLQMRLDY